MASIDYDTDVYDWPVDRLKPIRRDDADFYADDVCDHGNEVGRCVDCLDEHERVRARFAEYV